MPSIIFINPVHSLKRQGYVVCNESLIEFRLTEEWGRVIFSVDVNFHNLFKGEVI